MLIKLVHFKRIPGRQELLICLALVDEATNYQEVRKKGELANILKNWIEQEQYRAWTLTFPLFS